MGTHILMVTVVMISMGQAQEDRAQVKALGVFESELACRTMLEAVGPKVHSGWVNKALTKYNSILLNTYWDCKPMPKYFEDARVLGRAR